MSEGLQILFKWFNLDSYYPLPYSYYHSMYNCALSQSSHVDCQTLICVNPWQNKEILLTIQSESLLVFSSEFSTLEEQSFQHV